MKFKQGEKVITKKSYDGFREGIVGIVRCTSVNMGKYYFGVEIISEDFIRGGNDLNGQIDGLRGYFFPESILDSFTKRKNKNTFVEFKKGMSIKEYVGKLLKKETDKERIKQLRTFENCILPEKVKKAIEEAIVTVLRKDVFDKWGINEHFEKGLTNSILLYGPPGTGKTMVCESISSILGKNLMRIGNADIQSNIPGKTEKNITKAFEDAKNKNAVIMLDECDSILYNRDAVGAILSAEINHLLTEIERFEGVIVMTSNRLHKLDSALQRRIISKVELQLPTYEARIEIWKKLVPEKMPISRINVKKLAKPEISGGDIKNTILIAARKAIAQNKNRVEMKDFEEALNSVLESKDNFKKVQPQRFSEMVSKGKTKNMNETKSEGITKI